jgi:predicted ferric reductase
MNLATGQLRVTGAGTAEPPRARGGLGDLLVLAGIGSVLLVLALWVKNHGLSDLLQPGTMFTSAGRVSGLVSADLLLLQVLLMARVPWLERRYGQDRLAEWHRFTGFTSFNLMLAHILLITIGYAAAAHANVIREAWDLVVTYPGMLLALAATVALCLVVFTSIRAARRRLRYESWHLLHLYAYLGVGLAIPHELWTGTDFVFSGAATAYWWTVYALAAGATLAFRVALPVSRNLRHQLRVRAVVAEAPGVWSVWLTGHQLDRLPARAGQFFSFRFLNGPGWTRAHPYSLSAAPRRDLLRITVKELGDGSSVVRRLRPGTRVLIEGPYGALTGEARQTDRLTMIASGIGITPMRALLESLDYAYGAATLIYRARAEADFAFRSELDALAQHRGIRVTYLPGRRAGPGRWGPKGQGSDDKLLRRLVPDIANTDVFVCGPDEWMNAVITSAQRLGVPPEQLHTERFSW